MNAFTKSMQAAMTICAVGALTLAIGCEEADYRQDLDQQEMQQRGPNATTPTPNADRRQGLENDDLDDPIVPPDGVRPR